MTFFQLLSCWWLVLVARSGYESRATSTNHEPIERAGLLVPPSKFIFKNKAILYHESGKCKKNMRIAHIFRWLVVGAGGWKQMPN